MKKFTNQTKTRKAMYKEQQREMKAVNALLKILIGIVVLMFVSAFAMSAFGQITWRGDAKAEQATSSWRDTIPGSHTEYFEGMTLVYTCTHPNQHGPAWRLNTPPCQPVAIKLPRHVEKGSKKPTR